MTDDVQSSAFQPAPERQVDPAEWAATAAHVRESLAADGLPASDMAEAMNGFRFLDDSGWSWMFDGSQWLRWGGQTWAAQSPPATLRLQPFTLDWLPDPTEAPPAGIESIETADQGPPAALAPTPAAAAATPGGPAAVPAALAPSRASAEGATVALATAQAAAQPRVSAGSPASTVSVMPPWPPYRPTHRVPGGGMPAWSQPDAALAPQFRLDPWLDVMVEEATPNGWARVRASNGWIGWVDGRLLVPSPG